MADKLEQISNENFFTWVVDPNPPNKDYYPPEDLFVWVNFRALPKSRSIIETDGTYSSDLFDSRGVQFITSTEQNGNGYVTTNYTNIGGGQSSEREAFGIENIEMEYGASLVPKVKIKFVDVRGAALFNGYEFEDEKGLKYNSSEYSTFFRLPYPVFELTVKGFYGKAVTYCLHLMKWSASFDAQTGNFIIDAEFVGFTFAFLADIIMKYVMAITSSEIGASALEDANVISLNDFLVNLGQLTRISKEFKDSSVSYEELKVVNTILARLEKLESTIGRPVNIGITSEFGQPLPFPQIAVNVDQLFVRDVGLIAEQQSDNHDAIVEDLEKFVKEYNDFIKKRQGTYSYLSQYKIDSFNIATPALSYEINDTTTEIIIDEALKDGITTSINLVTTDTLRSRLGLSPTATKKFYIIDYHPFRQQVSKLKAEVGKKKNELERVVNEELNEKLGKELGFNLSIQNVFNIIMGNVQAFLDVVYSVAVEAENTNIQEDRIGRLRNIRSDINPDDNRIYPFPAIFDSDTGEEIWIGDVVGENNPAFPEIRLVKQVINALVASNDIPARNRVRNFSKNTVTSQPDGWIPVNPVDYTNNEYQNIDSLSFNGNIIPEELARVIVKRAIFGYDYSLYKESRLTNIAQTEASYAASQIENNIIKQVLKNFDTSDFVNQTLVASGFPNDSRLNLLNGFDFSTNRGVYISGFNDSDDETINQIVGQRKKVLPDELNETVESLGKSINDTLILQKNRSFHRDLNSNGLFVYGDATDTIWDNDALKNIKKFYKGRTTNDLKPNEPTNSPILGVLNDLTVIDGQINATVDYTKTTDREEKFRNNARRNIANNLTPQSIDEQCLFDTPYYTFSSDEFKGYLYLITYPLAKIEQFEKTFDLAGIYKFSRIQMAWVSAQFWRANRIKRDGNDIFNSEVDYLALNLSLQNVYDAFTKEFFELRDETATNYLPDLSKYTEDFVSQMVQYYENWVESVYKIGDDSGLEKKSIDYCALSTNGVFQTSADYPQYKIAYNYILMEVITLVDFLVVNPIKVLNSASTNRLNTPKLTQYLTRWIETFKKVVRIGNSNGVQINNTPVNTATQDQEFYVVDKDFKIATYRHFKTLYDKWIGGNKNGLIHNFCTYNAGNPRTSPLIDRFHFIDRTWSYIGDRAVINPKPLMVLSKSSDINLYSLIGRILRDSKFDFHVLPSWVNYKNVEDVYDMWRPHTDVDNASAGASYIAMYMGGTSKSLDIGDKAFYLNDGFDLRDYDKGNVPKGFKDRRVPANINDLEENEKLKYNMVVFRVGYADQNQSIFTNIPELSQNEHRETAESLQAISDATDNRGGTKRFYKGVNLYNVFALRSYKCTVTCMGNMQIHPLNYFQLDNIPFFHGAYLITKVRHSIRAHYVETTFTGRRVPRFVVPIVDNATSFVNIPLSDTLFKGNELRENIVRPLGNEEDEGYISDGENTAMNEVGEGLITTNDVIRGQEADNSLLDIVFDNRTFNFWILDDVTPESLTENINRVYNPNNPIKFKGVGVGDCYGWTKRSLKEIGVIQDASTGIDAWTFFVGLNDGDVEFQYIDESIFAENLGGWTNEAMINAGIPDGSFILCYHPNSPMFYRAIDRMINSGISQAKVDKLAKFRDLDTKTNFCSSNRTFCDTTPNSKKLFSRKGYRATHKESDWQNPPADGTRIPFVPVTHSAVFINGHCFHQLRDTLNRPSNTMRIVGYYHFKNKLYNKIGGGNFLQNITNFFSNIF